MPHRFDGKLAFSKDWAKRISSALDNLTEIAHLGSLSNLGTITIGIAKFDFATTIAIPALASYLLPKLNPRLKSRILAHEKKMAKVPIVGFDGIQEPAEPNIRVDTYRTDFDRD